MKLLVTGGSQYTNAVWAGEWSHYDQAIVAEIDWETSECRRVLEYTSPEDARAASVANIVFKAGSIHGESVVLCTQTEVMEYSYPQFDLKSYISSPYFNDVHHVVRMGANYIVASTGLDMVLTVSGSGIVNDFSHALGGDPWARHEQKTDYRKILSTKPHASHPNYIFVLEDEIWVTRFVQKDAISVSNPDRRINIGLEGVHDGFVTKHHVYFTTINGMVMVADRKSLSIEAVYDLNVAYNTNQPLGWCRGLYVCGEKLYVGFSALRSTMLRENLAWVRRGFKTGVNASRALPSRVVEYDMRTQTIDKEVRLDGIGMAAVFSIFAPPTAGFICDQ